MPYTLDVKFEGLCAFLPSHDIERKTLDWATVLMVDTKETEGNLKRHQPLIEFDLSHQSNQIGQIPERTMFTSWNLSDEDVFLVFDEPVAEPQLEVVTGFRASDAEQPESETSPDIVDFSWVPHLSDALPKEEAERLIGEQLDAGDISDDCIQERPSLVAARFHFNRGKLSVDDLVKVHDSVSVSQFLPSGAERPLRQAIAFRVLLRVEGVQGSIRLKARRFGHQEWTEVVLGSSDRNDPIEIRVKNFCSCGEQETESSRDHDFEWYYRLSLPSTAFTIKDLPAPAPVRYRIPGDLERRDPGGSEFKRCGVAQVSALSGNRKLRFEKLIEEMILPSSPGWRREGGRARQRRGRAQDVSGGAKDFIRGVEEGANLALAPVSMKASSRSARMPSFFRNLLTARRESIQVNRNKLDDFKIELQRGDYWCWAAVAVSIAKYYDQINPSGVASAPMQCTLVGKLLQESCCQGGQPVAQCDVTSNMESALKEVGHFVSKQSADAFLDAVAEEYARERPLVVKVKDWRVQNSIATHVLVVRGSFTDSSGVLYIRTLDPWYEENDYRFTYLKPRIQEIYRTQ